MVNRQMNRRHFVKVSGVSAAAVLLGGAGDEMDEPRWRVGGFTKPLEHLGLSPAETARAVEQIGWGAVELAVRPGGGVVPERVQDDLPAVVAAFREQGIHLITLATDIRQSRQPHAEAILRTARRLGIKYYRLGYWQYDLQSSIPRQLKEIHSQLRDLADLNAQLGLCGMFQNHSGARMVGAPVWDIYELIRELDPDQIGCFFDIGHATVAGGTAWPLHWNLLQSHVRGIIVKDFRWHLTEGEGGRVLWCPLGSGMVHHDFFHQIRDRRFDGPIIQHHEYPVAGQTKQEQLSNRLDGMAKDLQTLRLLLRAEPG